MAKDQPLKRDTLGAVLSRFGTSGMLLFALTCALGIWSWLALAVSPPQNFMMFDIIWLGWLCLATALQLALQTERAASRAPNFSTAVAAIPKGLSIVIVLPIAVVAAAMLVLTPPSTSA